MPRLLIDQDKCKQDNFCVAECPMLIIEMESGEYPHFTKTPFSNCISCGHCVAVCPHGALSLDFMAADECEPLNKELKISPDQVANLLKSRRSCRQYKDQAVPRADMEALMDLAFYAPSGHNRQPLDWIIVYDTKEVQKLGNMVQDWMRHTITENPEAAKALNMPGVIAACEAGNDRILRGCPHLIIAHAPATERTAPATCVGAISYIELAAPVMGLGSCWAGYFTHCCQSYPPILEALGLPQGHMVYGAVMVGYSKAKYFRIPTRKRPDVVWK